MLGNLCKNNNIYHIGNAISIPYSSLGCEIRVMNIDVNHSMDKC